MKKSTYELVSHYLDLRLMLDINPEMDDNEKEKINNHLKEIENDMLNKTDRLHWVLNKMKESEYSIKATIDAHKDTVSKLREKKKSILNAKERIKNLIMSIVEHKGETNRSGNLQLKTDTESFTIVNSFGPVEYAYEDNLPNTFKKYELKVDKKALRKHVLEEGGETDYAICQKIRRLSIR